jgi:S1-C subfamily serine protease
MKSLFVFFSFLLLSFNSIFAQELFPTKPPLPTPTPSPSPVPLSSYNFSQIKDNFSKYVVYVQSQGQATGVILTKHLVIINNHSVPSSKSVLVILWDGDENLYNNPKFIGNVIAQDEGNDLALLYVEEDLPDLPTLTFSKDSLSSLPTQEIFGIGNPHGWERGWSYTRGYVSKSPALCKLDKTEFVGITASIDGISGSSGSLYLNEKGEFLGMACMMVPGTRFIDIIPAQTIKQFLGKWLQMIMIQAQQNELSNGQKE